MDDLRQFQDLYGVADDGWGKSGGGEEVRRRRRTRIVSKCLRAVLSHCKHGDRNDTRSNFKQPVCAEKNVVYPLADIE
jgi:hypothetical protein